MAVVSYELAASGDAVEVAASARDIDIEALTGGGFAVAYRAPDPNTGTAQTFARAYTSGMIGAGDAHQFADGPYQRGQDQMLPDLVSLSGGGFAVAFLDGNYFRNTGSTQSTSAFAGGTFTATGALATSFVASYTSGTSATTDPGHFIWTGGDITAMAGGGFATVWDTPYRVNGGETSYRVYDDVRSATGEVLANDVYVTPEVQNAQLTQTAGLTNGAQVIVWSQPNFSTGNHVLLGRIRGADGVLGATFQIGAEPGVNNLATSNDQVIALSGGGFVVVWRHFNSATQATTLFSKQFDASGALVGTTVLASSGVSHDMAIDVTATADGGYLVAWASSTGTQLRQFDASGVSAKVTGMPAVIQAPDGGVAMLNDGRLVAAYINDAGQGVVQAYDRVRVVTGDATSETLTGTAANETLRGLGGNDSINGGRGADRMEGGLGNDTFFVDNLGDTVVELDGQGTDTVRSTLNFSLAGLFVENLVLLGAAATGTGNAMNNALTGNSAANVLLGEGGDDTLRGEGGADRMEGGAGNDTYAVENVDDTVIEADGQGTDSVRSTVSFSLAGQFAENLLLVGSGALNGTGNALNNVLTGGVGANVLSGDAGHDKLSGSLGDDRLIGGEGRDSLTGGAGSDTFVFDTEPEPQAYYEVITDFNHADDTIELSAAVFSGLSAGTLAEGAFASYSAPGAPGHRILYKHADGPDGDTAKDTVFLYYDETGGDHRDAVLFARLTGMPEMTLTADDFVIG